jgi:hypothetical protein
MSIESLTSMLSGKTGMQQSMASTIMNIVFNYIVQHFMQKGLLGNIRGSAGGSGNNNTGGGPGGLVLDSADRSSSSRGNASISSSSSSSSSLQSAISQLMSSSANNPSHPLVQEVKSKAGLQDDNQAKQYTQQALGVLHENAGKDSQGFGSLIGSFLGGKGQQGKGEEGGGGGLGDIVGGLLGEG